MGLSGIPRPARERFMEVTRDAMASSCPKTNCLSSPPRFSNFVLSGVETLMVGILAILATIFSMSLGWIFFLLEGPESLINAPASSITSMALSGR